MVNILALPREEPVSRDARKKLSWAVNGISNENKYSLKTAHRRKIFNTNDPINNNNNNNNFNNYNNIAGVDKEHNIKMYYIIFQYLLIFLFLHIGRFNFYSHSNNSTFIILYTSVLYVIHVISEIR